MDGLYWQLARTADLCVKCLRVNPYSSAGIIKINLYNHHGGQSQRLHNVQVRRRQAIVLIKPSNTARQGARKEIGIEGF